MFQGIRQRLRDMGTIKALCQGAERYALRDGQQEPGAEHFLLSALELPDGSARRSFERLQIDPALLPAAIARQHGEALRGIGLNPEALTALDPAPQPAARRLYRASASGQGVMQGLAAGRPGSKEPLLGAHVVVVIAGMRHGVAARALRALGLEPQTLAASAGQEIQASMPS
ncbi:MAG: Clp protease N-terminal domain-containing protein [Burkholderiaceae bacterium]|nr:Clp protease N-terminal domain-containing protein [Burkholderiaceae bacterium]